MNTMQNRKKTFGIILVLVLLFVIPVVLAKFVYAHQEYLPKTKVNHGQLLKLPVAMEILNLSPAPALGKWSLLLIQSGPCDKVCQHNLYYLRQIQQALGKNYDRLQRVVVVDQPEPADAALIALTNGPFTGTLLTYSNPQEWVKVMPDSQTWYLADPLGNIIMSYAATAKADDVLADLEYLMRVSQIG